MLEKKEELVLDAVNVGLLVLGKKSEDVIQEAVMEFVSKYGLCKYCHNAYFAKDEDSWFLQRGM